jgi:uncharacterized membrane protein YphA (DoxX/SURF4 family)
MSTRNKIIYWIATIWLSLGMFSTGVVQLLKGKGGAPGGLESMFHLGYPAYLLTLLGIWKILGVVAVLIPKFPLLKEWAYAGFFFAMSGAVYSHLEAGDPWGELFPSVLLIVMIAVSWYFRPMDRRIVSLNQQFAA